MQINFMIVVSLALAKDLFLIGSNIRKFGPLFIGFPVRLILVIYSVGYKPTGMFKKIKKVKMATNNFLKHSS